MKKRILTLLLTVSLLLSMCPLALAAEEDGARETDFFTDQPHADVDYADMEYRHIEAEPVLAEMEALRELIGDAANEKAVEEKFNAFTDQFQEIITMYTLMNIRSYQDVTDEEANAELEYTNGVYMQVADALILLIQDILESPCGGFLKAQLTEADIEYYTNYEAMTEEEMERSMKETALENEYMLAAYQTYTAEYEGKEWDDASLAAALQAGELDEETYTTISRQVAKNTNAALGDIYLRMIALRQEIAKSAGYDDYADYAYEEVYQRDYTKEEIRSFHQAVKENVVPLYNALYALYYFESGNPVYVQDYTGDIALDMIEPYISRLSSEMAEAFAYMRGHGLYDSGFSDTKADAGFTTLLDSYGAPFYFNAPSGDLYDFSTAVHEFGHYNNYYWQAAGWNDGSKSHDIAEVHSQGLELLFTHFYEEIFQSKEDAQAVQDYLLLNLSNALISGCLYDEFQQFAYTTENVTLDQLNQEYCRLCKDYGMIEADDPRTEMYGWYQVPHTFTSPCYYISYAVSASGAFAFWLDAQQGDYFAAVDEYLKFTAFPAEYGFQESFEKLGMDNPLSASYVEELVATLVEELDLEARINALIPSEEEPGTDEPAGEQPAVPESPKDLTGEEWFYDAVIALYEAGTIAADENGYVYPENPATWSDAAAMMAALVDESIPAEDGTAAISRIEFAKLMDLILDLAEDSVSPFSDTDDAVVAALVDLGVISGYPDGTFKPNQSLSRAEMCVIVYRALTIMASQVATPAA